jgi:peptide/nickel transport system substrate-binding protein
MRGSDDTVDVPSPTPRMGQSGSRTRIHVLARISGCLAVLMLVAFGVTSCSTSPPPVTGNDINSKDPQSLRNGGSLRLAIPKVPATFNPVHADAGGEYQMIAAALYPRAFRAGTDGSLTLNADYFTDVALTGTDPQVVTYTINPRAVWTDSSPITWQDIASQAHALSGTDPAFRTVTPAGFDQVASVTRGVDDRQAVMTFRKPYFAWRDMFSGNGGELLPHGVTETPEAFNTALTKGPGITAGPFVASHVHESPDADQDGKPDGGQVYLVRNPRWWGATPRLDSLSFTVIDPYDQISALQNGEIDAASVESPEQLASAQQLDRVAIRRARDRSWQGLFYNGAPGLVLGEPGLRQAISKAIDREAVARMTQRGLTAHPVLVNNHLLLPGDLGYQDNSAGHTYDPATARKELEDLGWRLHGDVREKDGKQLVLTENFVDTPQTWLLSNLVQDNLAQVGVKMVVPQGDEQPSSFDIGLWNVTSTVSVLSGLGPLYKTKGAYNFGAIGSAGLDKIIDDALTEFDEHYALRYVNNADESIWQEGHSLPLAQDPGLVAVDTDLGNFGAFGYADIDYTAIGFVMRIPE